MKINTVFGIDEYIRAVNEIADGYFDDDGNYVPHIGMIGAMETFYNLCVSEHEIPAKETGSDVRAFFDMIFADEEFLNAFNSAVEDYIPYRLNFGNAYENAMDIVNDRKHSVQRFASWTVSTLEKALDPDNLAKLFGESSRFEEIINGDNVSNMLKNIGDTK